MDSYLFLRVVCKMEQIIIRRPRMLLVLTETEIVIMLKNNPVLWTRALQRGKGLLRYEKSMERKGVK